VNRSAANAVYLAIACGLLGGCSETGFQGMFGAGKYSPDETQVSQNQSLAVPPDLQLRPPSNEAVPAPPPPARAAYAPPPQPVLTQPVATEPYAYEQSANAGQQTYAPPAPQQQVQPAPPPQDIYARLGISKTRPDGSPKSQGELNEELREKKVAAERAKNPDYGSIWNMGNVWSDSQ